MKDLLVVKVGTSTLLDEQNLLDQSQFDSIAKQLIEIEEEHDCIIVSSGAVSAGAEQKKQDRLLYGDDILAKQYFAAIGQPLLMNRWQEAYLPYGKAVGQCLITNFELEVEHEKGPFVATINRLLSSQDVPVVNENDPVATEELRVGDNDMIAARVAVAVANLGLWSICRVIELTDVDGVYEGYGTTDQQLIPVIDNPADFLHVISEERMASHGTGGMPTKFAAAKYTNASGISLTIANGREENVISRALESKTGTVIRNY